jgi:UDP-4-amino-4,6-dideoxy-N-acetyl-beta-L-altrosamine N-acetyltransferase
MPSINLRSMEARDLELVLSWRNHVSVREQMLSPAEIAWEGHQAWFERCSADPTRRLLVAEDAGVPVGFMQFSGVDQDAVMQWGFYRAPSAARGVGFSLCEVSLKHAFVDLGATKVHGQVLDFNDASLKLHERLGFVREGVLRRHQRAASGYADLHCFGLLREEWETRQEAMGKDRE